MGCLEAVTDVEGPARQRIQTSSLRTLVLLTVSFSLMLVSVWTARNASSGQPEWLVNLTRLTKVVCCLGAAATFRSYLPDVRRVFVACAVSCGMYAVAYLADLFVCAGSFGSLPAGVVVALAGGVEDALVLILVTHVLVAFPSRYAKVAIPAVYLLNEALYSLAALLPPAALVIARLVAAVLSALLLGVCLARSRAFDEDPSMRDVQHGFAMAADASGPLHILVDGRDWALVLVGTTLFPLVFGAVSQATGVAGLPGLYGWEYEAVALVLLAALTLCGPSLGERLSYPSVLGVSIPLFAGGCVLLPLLAQAGASAFAAGVMVKCGYTLYQVSFWMLVIRRAHDDPRHAYLFFGVFYGVFEFATLAARTIVLVLAAAFAQTLVLLFDICLVMLWLLAMYGLVFFLLSRRLDASADGLASTEDPSRPATGRASLPVDTLGLRLAAVERDFGLSSRECEVVTELVHGYSMENVGRKLGITKDTVKTHARRVYRKLGVTSKQELIGLLETYPLGE